MIAAYAVASAGAYESAPVLRRLVDVIVASAVAFGPDTAPSFVTCTGATLAAVRRLAGTAAVSDVAETYVVASAAPLSETCEHWLKFVPVSVIVAPLAPTVTPAGLSPASVGVVFAMHAWLQHWPPLQSASAVHAEHLPSPHLGVGAAQSVSAAHCTHFVPLHFGVVPPHAAQLVPQRASVVQAAHAFDAQ